MGTPRTSLYFDSIAHSEEIHPLSMKSRPATFLQHGFGAILIFCQYANLQNTLERSVRQHMAFAGGGL
jgi:hypothetical protein